MNYENLVMVISTLKFEDNCVAMEFLLLFQRIVLAAVFKTKPEMINFVDFNIWISMEFLHLFQRIAKWSSFGDLKNEITMQLISN